MPVASRTTCHTHRPQHEANVAAPNTNTRRGLPADTDSRGWRLVTEIEGSLVSLRQWQWDDAADPPALGRRHVHSDRQLKDGAPVVEALLHSEGAAIGGSAAKSQRTPAGSTGPCLLPRSR